MRSTFESLETARRALFAQQSALQTTSQNIANANTPGYSRQRVNLETTLSYPTPGLNNAVEPGQIGTGVKAGTIQRVRNDFLDTQYRQQSTEYGYWNGRSGALGKMQDVMNEPSDTGLSEVLNDFVNKLGDLQDNPDDSGTRAAFQQSGASVVNTFHYLSSSLKQDRGNLQDQINVDVKQVNSIADQINDINKQISQVEPHGDLPNDLYDKRDKLVDQLSELANVKVSTVKSGGESLDIAKGRYTIQITTDNGSAYTLVDGKNLHTNHLSATIDSTTGNASFSMKGKAISGSLSGKLAALKEANNKDFPNMLNKLDQMAYSLVNNFNAQHEKGYGLDGKSGYKFFSTLSQASGAAGAISLSTDVTGTNGLDHIAASSDGSKGDNQNASALADVLNGKMSIGGVSNSLEGYYESAVGGMAVGVQEANRMSDNSQTLQQSADKKRQSVSGVSIDEEMTNLIQYQHAYSAAARMITTIDGNLNTIINKMGLVG